MRVFAAAFVAVLSACSTEKANPPATNLACSSYAPAKEGALGIEQFNGIWGSGSSDVWVVGDGSARRWNGADWATTTPFRGSSIWGSGSDDVWVVTMADIARWDGASWTIALTPAAGSAFWAVGGAGPDDVWAFGGTDALGVGDAQHWDGSNWSTYSTGVSDSVSGVWVNSASDAWAVGWNGTILRWNGSAWSVSESGGSRVLRGMWASASDDVWAVGSNASATGGVVLRWNGSGWSSQEVAVPLTSVWGSGANDVWALGEGGAGMHWNGESWSTVTLASATTSFHGVFMTGSAELWAVGFDSAGSGGGLVMRCTR